MHQLLETYCHDKFRTRCICGRPADGEIVPEIGRTTFISLNRTTYRQTSGPARLIMIETEVDIELVNSRFGKVVGVTEHSGSVTSGHYVAYTKVGGGNGIKTMTKDELDKKHQILDMSILFL